MKKEGSLKLILSLLLIVLLILVSVGGIFVKDKNIMKNILPDYVLGMELDTNTVIKLEVSKTEEDSSESTQEESETETSEETESAETTTAEESTETEVDNTETSESTETTDEAAEETETQEDGQAKENIYTAENYKKSKKIIENRLKASEADQYTVRLDEQSGIIVLEVPTDTDTNVLQNIFVVGKTEIKISETSEIIGDHNSIKQVTTAIDDSYESYGIGSFVKLDIEFTKEATNKFKEIKNNYVVPTDEEGNATENNIEISIDGSAICSMTETEFLESAVLGSLPLKLGDYSTDTTSLNSTLNEANSIKNLMESEPLPITYSVNYTNDIHSNVSELGVISVMAVILIVMFAYLIIKHKFKGIISGVNILGYLSLLLLVLRYTKVQISIAAIVSIAVVAIIQFIYLIKLLDNKKISSKVFTDETIEFSKMIIPAFLMSIVIAFANITEISGFGMVIFWGIILFEIFNNIITRAILTNVKNK